MSTLPHFLPVPRPERILAAAAVTWLFLALPQPAMSQNHTTWADSAYALIQSDLTRILADQESYFEAHGNYATSLKDLGCRSSDGVTLGIYASAVGFSAAATHEALGPTLGCAV